MNLEEAELVVKIDRHLIRETQPQAQFIAHCKIAARRRLHSA